MRILTVVSLSCGALIDAALSPIRGKDSGEPGLLRSLISSFKVGDVALLDRYFSGYFTLTFLMHFGIDFVVRQHQARNNNSMHEVRRFSKEDRIVALARPYQFTWEQCPLSYDQFPLAILLREVTIKIQRRGFRPRVVKVLTSLLNPKEFSANDIRSLYAARWNIETDILNLKRSLQMDPLRCKTPEMVRREVWAHLMTYNFVRLVAAQAAQISNRTPRSISFQATVQILQAFRPLLMCAQSTDHWNTIYFTMLEAVSRQRIGNRPGRYEPRALKGRYRCPYPLLTISRSNARKRRLINPKKGTLRFSKFARS